MAQGGPTINAIEETYSDQSIRDVKKVKTPLTGLHARLVEPKLIKERHDNCYECSIKLGGFLVVQRDVQHMMDHVVVQIIHTEAAIGVVVIKSHFKLPSSVEVEY